MNTKARLDQLDCDMANLASQCREIAVELAQRGITLNIPQVQSGTVGGKRQ